MAYNPGNSDMSGQLLMQGISNMGQGLGGGIEKMMLEKKRKEEELKFAHSIRDSFAKMEKGHELLGYGSKDEMWADSLSNTLSRVNAQKVAGALKSIGLQERGDKARVTMAEGDAAAQPAKLQQAADLAALQKAIMQNSLDSSKAEADAKAKALAGRKSLVESIAGMSPDMPADERLAAAIAQNPDAIASEHNRDFMSLLTALNPARVREVKVDGKTVAIEKGNTVLPIRGTDPTQKDLSEIKKNEAQADLYRSKMTSAIDTLAPMQAQADVLGKLKQGGVKRVRVGDDGTVTDASGDWTNWSSIPIDEAIDRLHQASGGKVKFSSGPQQPASSKPKRVRQNGVEFELDSKTGQYAPVK